MAIMGRVPCLLRPHNTLLTSPKCSVLCMSRKGGRSQPSHVKSLSCAAGYAKIPGGTMVDLSGGEASEG